MFGIANARLQRDSHTVHISTISAKTNPSIDDVAAFVRDDAEISNGVPPLPSR